jgi:hypothetical protein
VAQHSLINVLYVRIDLQRSGRPSPTTRSVPLSRALIGGAQPLHGWWAPVTSAYKEVGGPDAHSTRFTVRRSPPPTRPTDLGFALGRREVSSRRHSHPPRSRRRPLRWLPARAHRAKVQVIPLPLRSLPLSLNVLFSDTEKIHYRVFDLA